MQITIEIPDKLAEYLTAVQPIPGGPLEAGEEDAVEVVTRLAMERVTDNMRRELRKLEEATAPRTPDEIDAEIKRRRDGGRAPKAGGR